MTRHAMQLLAMVASIGLTLMGLSSHAQQPQPGSLAAPAKVKQIDGRAFSFGEISFRTDFPAARLDDCLPLADDEFRLVVRPENTPINDSAWYAFQLESKTPARITVHLSYEGGRHRYRPKLSRDKQNWTELEGGAVRIAADRRQATFEVDAGPEPLWIAGQELVGIQELDAWAAKLDRLPFVELGGFGQSVEGRPLRKLDFQSSAGADHVVILGRQHPPEITGSLALMGFVDRLAEHDALADRFREKFHVLVTYLVNPDGVARGHWRHNVNGVDLNRDWAAFRQPETRAVRDEVLRVAAGGGRVYLLLDFHSTQQDVFYTPPDDAAVFPPRFASTWLAAVAKRLPGHSVRDSRGLSNKTTAQRWAHETLGSTAITYELGDNTRRPLIRTLARTSAEEMMRLLLAAQEAESSRRTSDLQTTRP